MSKYHLEKKKEIGVVWDLIKPIDKKIKIKKIEKKIEKLSINKKLVDFMNWFSMYNIIAKGKVLKMCVGDIKNMLKKVNYRHNQINLSKNNYILNKEQKNALSNLNKL